ncbi:MAG: phosphate acyltransferase PlsX [Phenylobacterium sp.]|uniref:phosphate acyltransferase PlsX n=1 Tax=Phenylobacterium sp. TaxID=1871053 RepID=UPI0027272F6E|nr:phosphate acyltransferase PlsX [Phenylobacterium sp.]MDO8912372.1 phosphate acyltransferase PlsX [Phenylobacterium sp.]MDP2008714.1 phosphate acyltransferase PlsX [Phenylobacterium sp.]MDP3099584.1 phosphate acyltransferase PlsX [Phenylobacterium sp.]MDP3633017.1 phosphate acyltransferase PlsX [Phenylobacterium sp.]MDP3867107.1 phosphate acyltransferase PlsX [Phenylobacterium sp.]
MTRSLVISIDAMGGDHGPSVTVPALALAAKAMPAGTRFLAHGDEAALASELVRHPALKTLVEVRHTDKVIASDEKPATALRRGKGSSMWNAVEAVKTGEAVAAVSSGNTGGLMAISKLILRMSVDVDRPCLVASWPGAKGLTTVLDVGANIDCDAERLVEFAIMGEAFHRAFHGVAKPTVGLINVGSEDVKGHEEVRQAHAILRSGKFDLDYRGFIEGDDLSKNTVDVAVTDGFTGNIMLKAAEGTGRYVEAELRAALTSSLITTAGALLARSGLRRFGQKLNPPRAAPLLGLNGVVVKSHGGAKAQDFADAIRMAASLSQSDFASEVEKNMTRLTAAVAESSAPAADGAATVD